MKKYLNMAFEDELGKSFTMRVDDPVDDVNADAVDGAAKVIVESGAFRVKGHLKEFVSADLLTINSQRIVDHRA
ncbi:hypothetical protein PEPNEM18_01594 [Aedoeadaptatus nemausensis]|uniref:DUF2922 domain-containing protein n=1 Tax=Aedoeadaptatus nemausensis TaxID=2582829 RepID=A0A6V6Y740_9FIRM|nr:DUF2922 domain-containing protein [Peptoniphilus nemausensis]CAC9935751.1 hypothetical protein PEPNEM18_01594 [Peptoniphilus nemausensis]